MSDRDWLKIIFIDSVHIDDAPDSVTPMSNSYCPGSQIRATDNDAVCPVCHQSFVPTASGKIPSHAKASAS